MIKGDLGWRISLGGAAVPAVLMIFSSLWVSETPNSLIERGHLDKAKKQLQRIRGVANIQAEFNDLVDASAASKEVEHPWRDLSMRKYRPQLCLAILIPMFQQLTGINVVMFYAPVLFKTIGFQSNASLASAMITGGVNVLATFISVFGTDRWGRKPLFLWGAFAFSWGPLGWLVPSEIFPLEIRSSAQSIVVAVNMSFTFLVAQLFLAALCMVKYGLFIIFAGLVLIMSLFIIFFVPETNNIPIEEMSQVWRGHCPMTNQFEVVWSVHPKVLDPVIGLQANGDYNEEEIYTLGEGSWRSIGKIPYIIVNDFFDEVLNGARHWLPFCCIVNDSLMHSSLVLFIGFIFIVLVQTLFVILTSGVNNFELFSNLLNLIALIKNSHIMCMSECYEDYGVKESWSKGFAVKDMIYNGKYPNYYKPIIILRSGQVLMIVDDEALVLCDLAKRHHKSVQISRIRSGSAFHGIGHVPILVSLKDVAKGENLKIWFILIRNDKKSCYRPQRRD
ncbi:hypothetical protein ACSBR1_012159 [Camellia fascicularis]